MRWTLGPRHCPDALLADRPRIAIHLTTAHLIAPANRSIPLSLSGDISTVLSPIPLISYDSSGQPRGREGTPAIAHPRKRLVTFHATLWRKNS